MRGSDHGIVKSIDHTLKNLMDLVVTQFDDIEVQAALWEALSEAQDKVRAAVKRGRA